MAPNGVPFNPIFALDSNFNLGIIPNKRLYIFADSKFWMQKAAPGITNPSQGQWDFSKREFDFNAGLAMSYYDWLELRLSAYSFANLNRGTSLAQPFGFKDGVQIETRFYLPTNDRYDVGRLSFVGVGYYPSKGMVGADGLEFQPGLFVRGYGTWDLPWWHSYLYLDTQFIADKSFKPRLLELDGGLAVRPLAAVRNLEFRVGHNVLQDFGPNITRNLTYSAVRFNY